LAEVTRGRLHRDLVETFIALAPDAMIRPDSR
jgi:hypothetical protein